MRLASVLRATKTEIAFGTWTAGHMPPSVFRVLKNQKTMKLGASWSWRVLKFNALGNPFRVLVMLNDDKGICRATLGLEDDELVRVCCVHEFHPSEPGWHCHAVEDVRDSVSHWSHFGLRRWPRRPDSQATFNADRMRALDAALRFYRVSVAGELL